MDIMSHSELPLTYSLEHSDVIDMVYSHKCLSMSNNVQIFVYVVW